MATVETLREGNLSEKVAKRLLQDAEVGLITTVQDIANVTQGVEKFQKKLTEPGHPYAFDMHIDFLTDAAIELATEMILKKKK